MYTKQTNIIIKLGNLLIKNPPHYVLSSAVHKVLTEHPAGTSCLFSLHFLFPLGRVLLIDSGAIVYSLVEHHGSYCCFAQSLNHKFYNSVHRSRFARFEYLVRHSVREVWFYFWFLSNLSELI